MSQAPQEPPSGLPPSESEGSRKLWIYLAVGTGVIILAVILFVALRPDDEKPCGKSNRDPMQRAHVWLKSATTGSMYPSATSLTPGR